MKNRNRMHMSDTDKARVLLALYTLYKIVNGANPFKAVLRAAVMDAESSKRVDNKRAKRDAKQGKPVKAPRRAGSAKLFGLGRHGVLWKLAGMALHHAKVF